MRWLFHAVAARLRRAICAVFGCLGPTATRIDDGPASGMWGVTVHCHRCWRRYTDSEQRAAVRVAAVADRDQLDPEEA